MPLRPPDDRRGRRGDASSAPGSPHATVVVRSPRAWRALLRGSRGLAESYAAGHWDTPDLTAVIRVAARNAPVLDAWRRRAPACASRTSARAARWCATRRARSRRDIAAHYDLGNELFELMLDPTLLLLLRGVRPPGHVARGRVRREARAGVREARARPVRPRAGDRHGLGRVRGARRRARAAAASPRTRSRRAQHAYARERVRAAGLEDRVDGAARRTTATLRGTLRQARLDRDDRGGRLEGLRHVLRAAARTGWRPTARCSCRRSRSTTAPTRSRTRRRASSDTHIFPDGCLPSLEVIARCVARAHRPAHGAPRRPHAALRRDAAPLARELRGGVEAGSPSSATTSASAGSGACTSPTARRASRERRIGLVQVVLAKPRWRGTVGAHAPAPPLSAVAG